MPNPHRSWPVTRWTGRRLAITVAVWSLFALLQTVLALIASPAAATTGFWRMLLADLLIAALWIVLTPVIALYSTLVDRWTRHPVRVVGAHLAAIAVISVVDTGWRRFLVVRFGDQVQQPYLAAMLFFVDFVVIVYLAIMVVGRTADAHTLHTIEARRELRLRAQIARARLEYLEEQLRPHFLFNALGTITELAHEAPRAASRMLRQLASLLRFALDERGTSVTLAEELAALEPYLDIQRVRFTDWLVIEQDVDAAALDLRVPRMLLQPLVENALRHGLVNRTSIGQLRITAAVEDGRLRLSVRDNGAGQSADRANHGFGMGLANMRERLATLYGAEASLSLSTPPDGGTIAEVILPMRREPLIDESGDVGTDAAPSATAPLLDWVRRHPAAATIAGWTIWGVLWLQQSIVYLTLRGRMAGMSLPRMAFEHGAAVAVWAALTPLVFRTARRFPLDPGRIRWTSAIHIPMACGVAIAQSAAFHQIIGSKLSLWSPSYAYMMLWSLTVYALFVGLAHQQVLSDWLRERDVAVSRLQAELAEARLVAGTSRARPEQILDTLEELADTVVTDSLGTERALSTLAGQLRRSLDGSTARTERPDYALP